MGEKRRGMGRRGGARPGGRGTGPLLWAPAVLGTLFAGCGGDDEGASVPTTTPRKIAFTSDRTGNYEIFVMNADGTGMTNFTNDPAVDEHPAWSSDGPGSPSGATASPTCRSSS